jgi:hypothetical protein
MGGGNMECHENRVTPHEHATALEIRGHVDVRSMNPTELMLSLRSLARAMAAEGVSIRPVVVFQLLLPQWIICVAEFGPPPPPPPTPQGGSR